MRIWRDIKLRWEGNHFQVRRWYKTGKREERYAVFYTVENHQNKIIAYFTKLKQAIEYGKGLDLDIFESK